MKCSFCNKNNEDVEAMVMATDMVAICDECIDLSENLIKGVKNKSYIVSNDCDIFYERIITDTTNYLDDNPNLQSLIVGLSGGIDSALVAALARDVCSTKKVKLIGAFIGIESSQDELDRAKLVGETYCDDFLVFDRLDKETEVYYMIHNRIQLMWNNTRDSEDMAEKIRGGNIKARLRMIYLFDLAHRFNGMVLSTDNYTEYLLGFWTLHGDVGNYGMIQSLWKTEVYGLSSYLQMTNKEEAAALKACHEALATDGLGITTTDMDQIMPKWKLMCETSEDAYRIVDEILYKYVHEGKDIVNPIINMMEKTNFKRRDPFNIKRHRFFS